MAANARHIPLAAQIVVPWRNGGGTTREVARGDGATGFRWRVSVAQVAGDGPFSNYPGVDRMLWLLRGAGMELRIADQLTCLERRYAMIAFAGEAAVTARLLSGPTEDLNVMVERGTTRVQARVFEVQGEHEERLCDASEALILALAGSVLVRLPGRPEIALECGDALELAPCAGHSVHLRGVARPSVLLWARFFRVPSAG